MSQFRSLLALGLVLFIALFYQNCSKPLQMADEPSVTNLDENPGNNDDPSRDYDPTDPNVQAIILSKTQNGASASSFVRTQTLYGRVHGMGATNVYSCASLAGDTYCNNEANWTLMPNADWSYNAGDKTWRSAKSWSGAQIGNYFMGFHDRNANTRATRNFSFTDPNLQVAIILSKTYNGTAETSLDRDSTIYGRVIGLGQEDVYSCLALASETFCDDDNNWTKMPNADWTYNTSDFTWRMARNFSNIQVGDFKGGWHDRRSGLRANMQITLTSP